MFAFFGAVLCGAVAALLLRCCCAVLFGALVLCGVVRCCMVRRGAVREVRYRRKEIDFTIFYACSSALWLCFLRRAYYSPMRCGTQAVLVVYVRRPVAMGL